MTVPPLIPWSGSDFPAYLQTIYDVFHSTFVMGGLTFQGKPIRARWTPAHDDKHFSFWHVISEKSESGKEEDRIPDLRRCERISLVAYTLANSGDKNAVWCWKNERTTSRGTESRYVFYLHAERFFVVLSEKENCFFLVTAFYIEHDGDHRKKCAEYKKHGDAR